jgi:hypothetical protein
VDTKKYVHSENLALFRNKLADQTISEEQRKTVEQLLAEEEAKDCPETANDQS